MLIVLSNGIFISLPFYSGLSVPLSFVFGFAICGLTWNIYRLTVVYCHHPVRRTATEMQDSVLRERHKMLSVPHVRRFDTKESGTERPE